MVCSHYIEFVTDDRHASIGSCISRVMTMLHGVMRHTGVNLGVSFPELSDDVIGSKVRVFGDVESLNTVLANPQIQDACRRSVCSLSVYVPCEVPAGATASCYVAERDVQANINATFNRKLARFNRRHSEPMSKEDQTRLRLHLVNKARRLPYFTVKSRHGVYPIYVTKREKVTEGNVFNSFGLGNMGGVVYDF